MTAGTTIVHAVWKTLGLELPPRRQPHLVRFFAGFKPLLPRAYASLLRAMARASIDSSIVRVRKDARHDPVELIAAALEVSIEQWDRDNVDRSPAATHHDRFRDVAIRIAAFEALFNLRSRGCHATMVALARTIEGEATPTIPAITDIVDRARLELQAVIGPTPEHVEALLAEIVILGSRSTSLAHVDACTPKALPLAYAMALVRAERIGDALAVLEAILDRVPGHTVALQQAARCCAQIGALSRMDAYTRRAAGRLELLPTRVHANYRGRHA